MSWNTIITQKGNTSKQWTLDLDTGDYYNPDSNGVLRAKCIAICVGMPIYAGVYIASSIYEVMKGEIVEGLKNIVHSAMYAISVIFAASAGLINPLQGRKLEAIIENHWQKGLSRHVDFGLEQRTNGPQAHYLAICFQPIRNIRESGTILLSDQVLARC